MPPKLFMASLWTFVGDDDDEEDDDDDYLFSNLFNEGVPFPHQ